MRVVNFEGIGINLNISNIFLKIGNVEIYWYAVCIVLSMTIANLLLKKDDGKYNIKFEDVLILLVFLIPISIIFARLYFVIFKLDYYINNPLQIFNIRNGGLAIYGGLIAGFIAACIVYKVKKMSLLRVADTAILGTVIGQILGRWGNFFNREAFGGYTNNLFAMQIKYDEVGGVISKSVRNQMKLVDGTSYIQVHPTFLYESAWNLMLFAIMMIMRKHKKFDGEIFAIYLIGYGVGRFMIEGLRTDQLILFSTGIAVSQIVSCIAVLAGIMIIMINIFKAKKQTA